MPCSVLKNISPVNQVVISNLEQPVKRGGFKEATMPNQIYNTTPHISKDLEIIREAARLSAKVFEEMQTVGADAGEIKEAILLNKQVFAMVESDSR